MSASTGSVPPSPAPGTPEWGYLQAGLAQGRLDGMTGMTQLAQNIASSAGNTGNQTNQGSNAARGVGERIVAPAPVENMWPASLIRDADIITRNDPVLTNNRGILTTPNPNFNNTQPLGPENTANNEFIYDSEHVQQLDNDLAGFLYQTTYPELDQSGNQVIDANGNVVMTTASVIDLLNCQQVTQDQISGFPFGSIADVLRGAAGADESRNREFLAQAVVDRSSQLLGEAVVLRKSGQLTESQFNTMWDLAWDAGSAGLNALLDDYNNRAAQANNTAGQAFNPVRINPLHEAPKLVTFMLDRVNNYSDQILDIKFPLNQEQRELVSTDMDSIGVFDGGKAKGLTGKGEFKDWAVNKMAVYHGIGAASVAAAHWILSPQMGDLASKGWIAATTGAVVYKASEIYSFFNRSGEKVQAHVVEAVSKRIKDQRNHATNPVDIRSPRNNPDTRARQFDNSQEVVVDNSGARSALQTEVETEQIENRNNSLTRRVPRLVATALAGALIVGPVAHEFENSINDTLSEAEDTTSEDVDDGSTDPNSGTRPENTGILPNSGRSEEDLRRQVENNPDLNGYIDEEGNRWIDSGGGNFVLDSSQ